MTPVYQTIIDPGHGNCMQAAIATLFDLPLEEVPNFIEYPDGYFHPLYELITSIGYDYHGGLYNEKLGDLMHPDSKTSEHFTLPNITKHPGVNGYFYATVYSPKYYDPNKSYANQITHAVIIDKDFNIVHDPNPNNKNIVYPLSDIIGFNGINYILVIDPKDI